jgi:asparagine synthase (glutamine-hydrolysing)
MSGFVGIVALDGSAISRELEEFGARALARLGGRTRFSRGAGALLIERHPPGADLQFQTSTHSPERPLFAALARLDNRDELGSALGLAGAELAQTADAALIQRMFERWGDAGVARCLGAFAFAHWSPAARRLTLGRDCLGNRPLFYHHGADFIVFATSLSVMLALPGVPRALDDLALAQFIAVNNGNHRQTFYRGINRVLSRTLVTFDPAGVQHRTYWSPDLEAPPPYRRDEDYIERARELFDQAVAAATRDTPRVAIATSGGLDSSAIAATAARLGTGDGISCFCMVPPAGTNVDVGPFRYLDERDKVRELGDMYPRLDVRFVAPGSTHADGLDDTRYFARWNVPAFAPAILGTDGYMSDAVTAAGHRVLLVGTYGNFGLTWWGLLALVELARTRQWGGFMRDWRATARANHQSLARALAANLVIPAASPRWRRLIYRLRGRDPDSVARHSALNPAFIADTGLARQWQQEGFDPWFGLRDSNPRRLRAYRLFDHNQYARDGRGAAEELFGYEIRDPHGDRRLLEFALSVPEPMYRRDGIERAFARRVLSDRLPPSILHERRRGANTPTWFRSLDARQKETAADLERLEALPLARRLLDLPRLKQLMQQWPKSENEAERRMPDYRLALARGVHVGRFIRWVEGGNA